MQNVRPGIIIVGAKHSNVFQMDVTFVFFGIHNNIITNITLLCLAAAATKTQKFFEASTSILR